MATKERPEALEWSERIDGRSATFVLTPSKMAGFPLLVFASVWDSLIVTLYQAIKHAPRPSPILSAIPVLHGLAAIVVTWTALARILNRATFSIDPREFALTASPIPAAGVRLPTAEIDRFEARAARSIAGGATSRVWLVPRAGRPLRVGPPLDEADHAAFIAARLNEAMRVARGGPSARS